jgi:hypothetical protein
MIRAFRQSRQRAGDAANAIEGALWPHGYAQMGELRPVLGR